MLEFPHGVLSAVLNYVFLQQLGVLRNVILLFLYCELFIKDRITKHNPDFSSVSRLKATYKSIT